MESKTTKDTAKGPSTIHPFYFFDQYEARTASRARTPLVVVIAHCQFRITALNGFAGFPLDIKKTRITANFLYLDSLYRYWRNRLYRVLLSAFSCVRSSTTIIMERIAFRASAQDLSTHSFDGASDCVFFGIDIVIIFGKRPNWSRVRSTVSLVKQIRKRAFATQHSKSFERNSCQIARQKFKVQAH